MRQLTNFLNIVIFCIIFNTQFTLGDTRQEGFTLNPSDIQNNFVRGFAKEYFKEMIVAYSAYIPNVDIDISEMNKTIEERLIPCMEKISLDMGYSNILEMKHHLKGFISFAKMYKSNWMLKNQNLNEFAHTMIYEFNSFFSWNYGICVFNEEDPKVEYHGIDYIDTLAKTLRVEVVIQRLFSLYDHSSKLEAFEKAMNNLMIELRNGVEKLDFSVLGRELCKAYLIFDPFPVLPNPNSALNLFNITMSYIPIKLPLITTVPSYLINDIIQGSKCLYLTSPSNITKFINLIYLRYANSKLGTFFNLSNDDAFRVGKEFVKIILAISNLFKDSLGCFNSTTCGYRITDYFKNATFFSQNWNFMNNFFQLYNSCSSPGFTSCKSFSDYLSLIFRVLDNYIYHPNQDLSSFAYNILQLLDILISYSNYHPYYEVPFLCSTYSTNF